MGLIDERYDLATLANRTAPLRRAATALGVIERAMRTDPASAAKGLRHWRKNASIWQTPLRALEAKSLYNPVVLTGWLSPAR